MRGTRTGALAALLLCVLAVPAAAVPLEREEPPGRRTDAVTEHNDWDGVPDGIADPGDNRHPSGRDRSVEAGGSGSQGASGSAPDEDGRGAERDLGGTDKPNGYGGADVEDQDRNNGCGNDDDFEDDNEGLCGRKRPAALAPETISSTPEASESTPAPTTVMAEEAAGAVGASGANGAWWMSAASIRLWIEGADVQGDLLDARLAPAVEAPVAVLGSHYAVDSSVDLPRSPGARGSRLVLPMTGLEFAPILLAALLLLTVGGLLRLEGNPRNAE